MIGTIPSPLPEKHPCRDCHYCQWCPETRCRVCLSAANHPDLSACKTIRTTIKKYPCPDCDFCRWCVESRCRVCREVSL